MSSISPISKRQQICKGSNRTFNSREFGDSLRKSKKSKDIIRYSFQNVRGFGTGHDHERSIQISVLVFTSQT